jgi:hypothetical protein
VDVDVRIIAPRSFVFVEERRFLEPVRPKTVIVNNTTIINQTVNITNIKVVNNTVINEGPRTQVIERVSGRKVQSVPVRELRRTQEAAVVARQRTAPPEIRKTVQSPVSEAEPRETKVVPARELRPPVAEPLETRKELQPPAKRNENRVVGEPNLSPKPARPEVERPAANDGKQELKSEKARSATAPAVAGPKVQPEAKPGTVPVRRETRPAEKPTEATKQPQPTVQRNEVRGAGGQQSTPKSAQPSPKPAQASPKPVRPEAEKLQGNERQRELERVKAKPGPGQPAGVEKSTQPPAAGATVKTKPSAKEKPAASRPGAKNPKKKVDDKQAEKEETPPPPASVPPRQP